MTTNKLTLELLNGPLDGHIITLEEETTWGTKGEGPLVFPWDAELGNPQARFFPEGDEWRLQGYSADHGTYRANRGERVEQAIRLEVRDVLKANDTWLLVQQIE